MFHSTKRASLSKGVGKTGSPGVRKTERPKDRKTGSLHSQGENNYNLVDSRQ